MVYPSVACKSIYEQVWSYLVVASGPLYQFRSLTSLSRSKLRILCSQLPPACANALCRSLALTGSPHEPDARTAVSKKGKPGAAECTTVIWNDGGIITPIRICPVTPRADLLDVRCRASCTTAEPLSSGPTDAGLGRIPRCRRCRATSRP